MRLQHSLADPLGAFVPHAPHGEYHSPSGARPLTGLRLAAKDLFHIAGLPTGAGTPAWLETHAVPDVTASAAARLLAAGARFVGKTITDELAWSLAGTNPHYGTPRNVAAPGCVAGGSSSGSASAVAGGLADFALGTDTGGSLRLPASYCGLWTLRPTHGRIATDGLVPLAPGFDTAGGLARDAHTLAEAYTCLLQQQSTAHDFRTSMIADDAFGLLPGAAATALRVTAGHLARRIGPAQGIDLLGYGGLQSARDAFRILQSAEAAAGHGAWLARCRPSLGAGVRERFEAAAQVQPGAIRSARRQRQAISDVLRAQLGDHAVVILPAAASRPPRRQATPSAMEAVRARALCLLSPAGLAGLPCLTVPALAAPLGPIGLALLGPEGSDERLLALAVTLETGGWPVRGRSA